jgi:hypothetical protein
MANGSGGMYDLAKKTREKVDNAMAVIEEQLVKAANVDMESLRPQVTDKEAFDQLAALVNEATQKNCTIAELKDKVFTLGANVKDTAVEVAAIVKKVASKIP